jgi:hypothetical protein
MLGSYQGIASAKPKTAAKEVAPSGAAGRNITFSVSLYIRR